MTYNGSEDEAKPTSATKVVVLGAGPYRIGSSVEFDWGTMNMAWALKANGVEEVWWSTATPRPSPPTST